MKTRQLSFIFFITAILAACAPVEKPAPDQVTLQLKWVHQAQFAGFYSAEAQGFYEDENIEITILPGGVGIDIFEGVSNGDVAFSVVSADGLFIEKAAEKPVTAIATIYRLNPFMLVAFADSGISTPYDFVGKTLAVAGGTNRVQLIAMLNNLDIDISEINVIDYPSDDSGFLEGEIDVINSYAAGSLLPLKEKIGDREINLIWPDDYGVHFYSDTIIVNNQLLEDKPDLVERFLRATLEGHRYAVENPEDAVDATMQYAAVQDRKVQTDMLNASIPMIHTGAGPIGWMEYDAWRGMHDILLEQGILAEPLDLNQLYTMEFLERIYGD